MSSESAISSTMQENRKFPPPPAFSAVARVKTREEYNTLYKESIQEPDKFWTRIASELHWFQKWDKVLDWQVPNAKWFVNAKTNISFNCLDQQIAQGHGDKTAILWEGEPETAPGAGGEVRRISFNQLRDDVCRFTNGLKKLGVVKGDRVTIYMPQVPEAAVAMLACARLGAAHAGSSSPPTAAIAGVRWCL
jgi:acetyl-CoA synthetase